MISSHSKSQAISRPIFRFQEPLYLRSQSWAPFLISLHSEYLPSMNGCHGHSPGEGQGNEAVRRCLGVSQVPHLLSQNSIHFGSRRIFLL